MCQKCGNNACGGCQPQIPQGLPGANGKNAYNFTTASFTMPAVSADATITVRTTGQFTNQWAIPGQIVYITGAGHFEVQSLVGNNQIVVRNLGYTGNNAPAVTIPSGATVSPAGLIGLTGAAGGNGINGAANVYSDTTNTAITSTALSTIKTAPIPSTALAGDNDAIQVMFALFSSENFGQNNIIKLSFGGSQIFPASNNPVNSFKLITGRAQFNIRIVRTSATTAKVYYLASGLAVGIGTSNGKPISQEIVLTGLNYAITNNLILEGQCIGNIGNVNQIEAFGIFVDKIVTPI
jgi:hypothetical protein